MKRLENGDPFGCHRVLEPVGSMPQPADRLNNDMETLWDNEILVRVEALNIDSASFEQIKKSVGRDIKSIEAAILDIVDRRGKMHNPVTGSGGMFIGQVAALGPRIAGIRDLEISARIAGLVSLSLTPLKIDAITSININTDQVFIEGNAVLFESGIYAKMPDDIPEKLALAVLDVAGAPVQTRRLVNSGDTVVVIGATGKSGALVAYEARKKVGDSGKVIGIGTSEKKIARMKKLGLFDTVLKLDATDAVACYNAINNETQGKMADVVINCANIPNTEMASILSCKNGGTVYFFSMATSFTKAALGAEGVGKDINMIIGNGYAKDHADIALGILRESREIQDLYTSIYL